MAWERGYYYHVRKVAGRVQRRYCGRGLDARLLADAVAEARVRRDQARAAWRAEQARLAGADAALRSLIDLTDLLTRAALVVAGYRQHHRGEWRKPRVRRPDPAGPASP